MPIREYTSADFDALQHAVRRVNATRQYYPALHHRPFVAHYYTNQPWSKLYLARSEDGPIQAVIGVELMRFMRGTTEFTVAFGTNYFSLQPGLGGHMYLRWLLPERIGMIYGGGADTHALIRGRHWCYFPRVKGFHLNRSYRAAASDSTWRVAQKWVLRLATRRRRRPLSAYAGGIPTRIASSMTVDAVPAFTDGMVPKQSSFGLRFAPTANCVRWRYAPDLSYVRYHLFRVCRRGASVGYVVLQAAPDGIVVAHCDGEDPESMAYGILLSLLSTEALEGIPEVRLMSTHPTMQRVFTDFGFRPFPGGRPLAMGRLRGALNLPTDTSDWLVNFAWGDNGLRSPFLDER